MKKITKIHQLVEQQAEKTPYHLAVSESGISLTYQKLNSKANQLARYLIQNGVTPGDTVAIVSSKSIHVVISILAILKAGATYIPINIDLPEGPISEIVKDAKVKHVLAQSSYARIFQDTPFVTTNLDNLQHLIEDYPHTNFEIDADHANNAYVIYTSGTTGKPKGVIITHDNLLNTYQSWEAIYQLSPSDTHLQMANVSFDVFTGDLIRALCSGGKLVLCPKSVLLTPEELYKIIINEKITVAEFVPAVLRSLLPFLDINEYRLSHIRLLICGSDQWTMREYRQARKLVVGENSRVINSYGLSEATIDSSYYEENIESNLPDDSLVPIGKPFPHVEIRLDDQGRIYIGGAGVAKGYLNLPDLTAEKFPSNYESSGRFYKTDDIARLLPDGNIAFLGRDHLQIKVDGKKVEIPAIEAIIAQHSKIKHAIVTHTTGINDKIYLNCFFTLRNESITHSEITTYLKESLPSYCIPRNFYEVAEIGLTTNGKINRHHLSLKIRREIKPQKIVPTDGLEVQLLHIWERILGLSDIGITSDFYDLGGSSLLFAAMLARVNKELGLNLDIKINVSTVDNLAAHIRKIREPTPLISSRVTHHIAIIGGGPASVSLCMQLVNQFNALNSQQEIEISVFEKGDRIGPGLPYLLEEDCYILNLPKEIMEPVFGETGHFKKWIAENPSLQQGSKFPPRHYFGKYLEYQAKQTQIKAAKARIKINYLTNTEVLDIQEGENGFQIMTNQKNQYRASYVVLSTGHMPSSNYKEFIGKKGFRHDPWNHNAYDDIGPHEEVGILGTRLTAIDILRKLQQRKHQGPIWMVSRSGMLPAVLANEIPPYPLKYLTQTTFVNLTDSGVNPLPLKNLMDLFWKEISDAQGYSCDLKSVQKSIRDISALQWLNQQITRAEVVAPPWQQVLFAIYPIVSSIWAMLPLEDQKTFLKDYYSLFMTYLAAFPLDNARMVRSALESGQLKIYGGMESIKQVNNQYNLTINDQNSITAKHLFNATCTGHDPSVIRLYKRMLERGIIRKDELGGIEVNPHTLQVTSKAGKLNQQLFAVGELTKGVCWEATDINGAAFQARRTATLIARHTLTHDASSFMFSNRQHYHTARLLAHENSYKYTASVKLFKPLLQTTVMAISQSAVSSFRTLFRK